MEDLLNAKRNADKRYFEDEIRKFCKKHIIGMQYAAEAKPWTWRYMFCKYVPTDDSGDDSHVFKETSVIIDYENDSKMLKVVDTEENSSS